MSLRESAKVLILLKLAEGSRPPGTRQPLIVRGARATIVVALITANQGSRRLCPGVPTRLTGGQRDGAALGLVERATFVVVAISGAGLVFDIQEPVLLRLLAEATGTRPGVAKLGRHGADGDAIAE
jgi:hypothetical protein